MTAPLLLEGIGMCTDVGLPFRLLGLTGMAGSWGKEEAAPRHTCRSQGEPCLVDFCDSYTCVLNQIFTVHLLKYL